MNCEHDACVWTRLNWRGTGSGGGILVTRQWILGFHKRQRNSWLGAILSVSQEPNLCTYSRVHCNWNLRRMAHAPFQRHSHSVPHCLVHSILCDGNKINCKSNYGHTWEITEIHKGFWCEILKEMALERPRRRREDNIKISLTKMGSESMEWIYVAQGTTPHEIKVWL
jgi:hypothetical protein